MDICILINKNNYWHTLTFHSWITDSKPAVLNNTMIVNNITNNNYNYNYTITISFGRRETNYSTISYIIQPTNTRNIILWLGCIKKGQYQMFSASLILCGDNWKIIPILLVMQDSNSEQSKYCGKPYLSRWVIMKSILQRLILLFYERWSIRK